MDVNQRTRTPRSFADSAIVFSFLAVYFLSGFAALLYQVVWQRILAIFSGADLFATTTVVASFMAGLGLGSIVAGAIADRVSLRWQVGLFVAAETLTGVFGWFSTWWYYDILYKQFGEIANSPVLLVVILFGSLLVPTFMMGMTLPLLAKAITPAVELAGRRIGSLYAWNTLGAAAGALATAWAILGRYDFQQIARIGAVINFAAAVVAGVVALSLSRPDTASGPQVSVSRQIPVRAPSGFSFATWILVYALSGFVALSLEILWFRILGVMLKSNALTFPHLLGIFLLSLAGGIFAGSLVVKFVKRPAALFLSMQAGIVLYAGASIVMLIWGLEHVSWLEWLRTHLAGYDIVPVTNAPTGILAWITTPGPHRTLLKLYILLPLALIAPPVLMMGMSFPLLQRVVHDSHEFLARRVGWLQGSNILGATIGSVLTGGVFLEVFGTPWTLRLLIAVGGTFLFLAIRVLLKTPVTTRAGYIAAAAVLVVLMGAVPRSSQLWATLHGSPEQHVIVSEEGSGLFVLKNADPAFSQTTWVYNNGLGQSWIPYHHVSVIHSRLGILGTLMHPAPEEIVVIGLGSGDTAYSLGGRAETKEITCVEILQSQLGGLRTLHERRPYEGLAFLLGDSRMKYVYGDGRHFLASSSKKYDIIEADALRATSAFAGNLYSLEYFELLKSRLKPGGLALNWAPTHRTLMTFAKVFPHVYNFDSVMVGSNEPIEFDEATIRARLEHPFTKAHYAKAGLKLEEIILPFFARKIEEFRIDPMQFFISDWNTDLFPKDEYSRQ
jgi:spermidine synthase